MSREALRSSEERGCVVAALGPPLVCGVEPVSLRCEDSRSNSEPRDALLPSETLGADACGVGFGVPVSMRLPIRLLPVRSGASIRCGGAYIRAVSTGALGAILSVARGVRSGCTGLLSIRSNTEPRLGALGAEGALTRGAEGALIRGADGASNERPGALTAGGLLRKTGACDLLSKRGLGDGWNDRDGPGDGADGRELNDGLRLIEPMFGPPPPRFPNDGDGAIDRLGADALGADRDAWPEPPPPRLPPPLP